MRSHLILLAGALAASLAAGGSASAQTFNGSIGIKQPTFGFVGGPPGCRLAPGSRACAQGAAGPARDTGIVRTGSSVTAHGRKR